MADRTHAFIVLVGRKGTGKSTLLAHRARQYAKKTGKRSLIIDVNGAPAYNGIQQIDYKDFPRWKKGVKKFYDPDTKKMLQFLADHYDNGQMTFSNGLLVFEDCTKYIPPYPQPEIKTITVDHRMRGLDVIVTFHALEFVPKFFWQMATHVTIMKTQEDLDPKALKARRVPNFQQVYEAWRRVMDNKNPYHFEDVETLI